MKEILESRDIIKITFDCRRDSDSLWEEYKVKLTNVLDMQLFEYMVRPIARTNLREPFKPWHYRQQCIRGLDNTVKTYVSYSDLRMTGIRNFELVKKCGGNIMNNCRTVWRYRPLDDGLKRYAALDVEMIHLVKDTLVKKLKLDGIQLERLKVASERYASVRRDHEKPDDVYIRHQMILSHIIPEINCGVLKEFREEKMCQGCKRMLPRSFVRNGKCEDCLEIKRVNTHRPVRM